MHACLNASRCEDRRQQRSYHLIAHCRSTYYHKRYNFLLASPPGWRNTHEEAPSPELFNGASEPGRLLSFFTAFAQKVSFGFQTNGWRLEIELVARKSLTGEYQREEPRFRSNAISPQTKIRLPKIPQDLEMLLMLLSTMVPSGFLYLWIDALPPKVQQSHNIALDHWTTNSMRWIRAAKTI